MSASSPYKSRLFNFLTDRAVRWGDRAAQAWRQAQLTATTVAHTVLLPLWAIAKRIGLNPPQMAGNPSERSAFAPGTDNDRDLEGDAPIRATLTILEAVGWPTVDRLERQALQPNRSSVAGTPEASTAAADPPPPARPSKWRRWLDHLSGGDRGAQIPTPTPPPEPLTLELEEGELRAIAPAVTPRVPIRGLANSIDRREGAALVLVSATNETVAHLSPLAQRTLDRDVRTLLASLPTTATMPAVHVPVVPALPAAVQPLVTAIVPPLRSLLLHLDTAIATLDNSWREPEVGSGTASGAISPFDLHRAFTLAALETAINTPLQELEQPKLPALQSWVQMSRARLRSLLPDVTARPNSTNSTQVPPFSPPPASPASQTTIAEVQWSLDPTDPWWRNAIDLMRAVVTSTTRAIVLVAKPTAYTTTPCTPSVTTSGGVEFDPDWIDSEVKDSRYVMHPLERLLRWLDRVMVWLESVTEPAIAAFSRWWSRRRQP